MEKLFETWSLEREIVLVKVLKHPRHKVFAAWMDPDALAQWYGPTGLAIENQEADIREGGVWRFDMVGVLEGQQQRFPSLMRFRSEEHTSELQSLMRKSYAVHCFKK